MEEKIWFSTVNPGISEFSTLPVKTIIDEFMLNEGYNNITSLCLIMKAYGSDKGIDWHNYTSLYSKLFHDYRDSNLNIFEMGIGPSIMVPNAKPGASLYGWRMYFPNAHIFGADIDEKALINDGDISSYHCDQTDGNAVKSMFLKEVLKNIFFDLIIDDGLHEFHANFTFLAMSIDRLKNGGIFIVEDILEKTRMEFQKLLPTLKEIWSLKYIEIIEIPLERNKNDNRLLIIQK
jgi:hypothetical protein